MHDFLEKKEEEENRKDYFLQYFHLIFLKKFKKYIS